MQKRGQLTIFIILAIVIVVVVVLFVVLRNNVGPVESEDNVPEGARPVYNFIKNCVEETTKKAFLDNAQYGGYFVLPQKITTDGIPYYYYGGKSIAPSKEALETEAEKYVNQHLDYCTLNFVELLEYKVVARNASSDLKINGNYSTVDLSYRVYVSKNGTSYELDRFTGIKVDTRYLDMYSLAQEVVVLYAKDPSRLCISCLRELGYQSGADISVIQVPDESTLIYQIKDLLSEINEPQLQFRFAIKYNA